MDMDLRNIRSSPDLLSGDQARPAGRWELWIVGRKNSFVKAGIRPLLIRNGDIGQRIGSLGMELRW
jgi:hypothetical protein